jgi:hypothetical protein
VPAAFFIVRSTVADPAKRAAFDKWYQNDFWPDVLKSLGVKMEAFYTLSALSRSSRDPTLQWC